MAAYKLYNTISDAVTSLRGQQNQGLQRGMDRGPAGQDRGGHLGSQIGNSRVFALCMAGHAQYSFQTLFYL